MSRTVVQAVRPFDYAYDPTVTMTGGVRGLERAGEAATAGRVATMPNASNMFSDLPQYPRTVTRPDGARFAPPAAVLAGPSTAANGGVQRPAALPAPRLEELVHAQDRYKYYKRPNVGIVDPAVATIRLNQNPANVKLNAAPSSMGAAAVHTSSPRTGGTATVEEEGVREADGSRSIGIQTMYRDSAAQTEPYTPAVVLAPGTKPPEVLKLAGLRVGGTPGASLPAGRAEIEAIELARRRARLEASLPPTTDEASFAVRKRLMETLELAAWRTREGEIDIDNGARMEEVERQLRAREAEREFVSEQRVEELRRTLAAQRAAAEVSLSASRMKTLRKLGRQHRTHEDHIDMMVGTGAWGAATGMGGGKRTRDIIGEYANYGSRVYAPMARDGRFPDRQPPSESGIAAAATAAAVAVATASLHGARALAAPGTGTGSVSAADNLRVLSSTLPPSMLQATVSAPVVSSPTSAEARKLEAIAQDLERVHNAIATVKAGRSTAAIENEEVPSWRKPKALVERPRTPCFEEEDGGGEEAELARAVLLVQTLLRGRAVQNVMFEGKQRRLELIHEMRADLLTPEAAAEILAREAELAAEEEARAAAAAAVHTVSGEVTSAALDFFSKELTRVQQVSHIAALAAAADAERARREAAETATREAELAARAAHAARTAALARVNKQTASTLVSSVLRNMVRAHAVSQAGMEARVLHVLVGPILDKIEMELAPPAAPTAVVRDLLAGQVLPAVQREMVADVAAVNEAHFESAAQQGAAIAVDAAAAVLAGEAASTSAAVQEAAKKLDPAAAAVKIQAAFRGDKTRRELGIPRIVSS